MNEIKYPPGCKEIEYELPNDELIRRLKKIQIAYQNIEQNTDEKYKELALYLGSDVFLQNDNEDVQLLVACCLADIFRIFSPECPFENTTNLKNIFYFLANQLKGLKDYADSSFKRYFYLLENLECVKTFHLCVDLDESQEIIAHLCDIVFKIISEKHNAKVKSLLFDLLSQLVNEPDQLIPKTCEIILSRIIEPQKSNNKDAYQLAVDLIKKGGENFEFFFQNFLSNIVLSGKTETTKFINDKLCLIIYELNHIRSSLLELALPQLEYKIKSSDLKERREFTKILSKMFSESDSKLTQQVPQLWEAYLERFADESDDIRKICAQSVGDFLINHPEVKDKIIEMTNGLSLDTDENIRIEMIQEIFRAMKLDISLIEARLLGILKDRCLDIRPRVRKIVLQGLGSLYKKIHASIKNKELFNKIEWLPTKILRSHFLESSEDKLLIERLLNSSLVPYNLPTNERMIQLYYIYCTLNDDASIMSLLEIIRERIYLNHSMKLIIDALDEGKDEQSDSIKKQIDFISKNLYDVQKGHEFMKALLKLFKENLNLKAHFKNLVDPTCSSSKAIELINLILNNLNSLNTSNSNMAKRLIERMSSIILDEESIICLLDLIERKIVPKKDDHEVSFIKDNGENGLKLVDFLLKLHQNRLNSKELYEKLHQFLSIKKDNVCASVLKILSSYFTKMSDDDKNEINEQYLPQLRNFIKNGLPKEAKYALKNIHANFAQHEEILEELYKEILDDVSIKNEKTYVTNLVSLGHLSLLIPSKIGLNLRPFLTTKIHQELFKDKILTSKSDDIHKLAGKWCDNDDELPFETRAQMEGIKLITRWILSLKTQCPLITPAMRLFGKIMGEKGDVNQSGKSEPEKTRLRLLCATQLLKIVQEKEISLFLTPELFLIMSRIIIDPVYQAREVFIKKLNRAFTNRRLPIRFMSLFALCGFDTNRERRNKYKKNYLNVLKIFQDANKRVDVNADRENNETKPNWVKNLPENCLPYVISLLAHHSKIDSMKDETQIKQIKECLHFILDPLLEHPDSFQIAYMKEILNEIKNHNDGIILSLVATSAPEQKLTISNNLLFMNRRLYIISEIAYFIIHSSVTHFTAPKDAQKPSIELPPGFYSKKISSEAAGSEENQPIEELNITLKQIEEAEQKEKKRPETVKIVRARKRRAMQQFDDTMAELNTNPINPKFQSTKINLSIESNKSSGGLSTHSSGSSIGSNSDDAKKAKIDEENVDEEEISKEQNTEKVVSNSSIVIKKMTQEEKAERDQKSTPQRTSKRLASKRKSENENEPATQETNTRSLRSRSRKS